MIAKKLHQGFILLILLAYLVNSLVKPVIVKLNVHLVDLIPIVEILTQDVLVKVELMLLGKNV